MKGGRNEQLVIAAEEKNVFRFVKTGQHPLWKSWKWAMIGVAVYTLGQLYGDRQQLR